MSDIAMATTPSPSIHRHPRTHAHHAHDTTIHPPTYPQTHSPTHPLTHPLARTLAPSLTRRQSSTGCPRPRSRCCRWRGTCPCRTGRCRGSCRARTRASRRCPSRRLVTSADKVPNMAVKASHQHQIGRFQARSGEDVSTERALRPYIHRAASSAQSNVREREPAARPEYLCKQPCSPPPVLEQENSVCFENNVDLFPRPSLLPPSGTTLRAGFHHTGLLLASPRRQTDHVPSRPTPSCRAGTSRGLRRWYLTT